MKRGDVWGGRGEGRGGLRTKNHIWENWIVLIFDVFGEIV